MYKKSQILLSLSPHEKRNECKFIFERHRKKKNQIKYEIRIKLFGFNQTRMRLETDCFKSIVVREDHHFDVISESMIFEELDDFDNYVLLVEMVPLAFLQNFDENFGYSNPDDFLMSAESQEYFRNGKLKFGEDLLMSVSLFSYYETQLATIPFRELVQKSVFEFSNIQNIFIKFRVLQKAEIELRVEGRPDKNYWIGISDLFHKFGQKENQPKTTQQVFLSKNLSRSPRANILTVMLPRGNYFLHFLEFEANEEPIPNLGGSGKSDGGSPKETQPGHSYRIEIHALNENYIEDYSKSVEKIEVQPETVSKSKETVHKSKCIDQVFFEAEFLRKFELNHSQTVSGSWSPSINKGTKRFKPQILQNFHYNSGFVISVESDSQVAFNVHPRSIKDENCIFKAYLFQLKDNLELVPLLEPESYCVCEDFESDVFYLTKNQNGYLIVLVPRFEHFRSDFQVVIKSDAPLANIRSNQSGICNFPWKKTFDGQIKNFQGGNPRTYSFFLNQNFTISLNPRPNSPTEELFVEVVVHNYSKKYIGLYVLPMPAPKDLLQMNLDELNSAFMTSNFLPERNTLHTKLSPGTYMIIPTTFETLKEVFALDYSLKIFSTSQFSLNPSQNFELKEIIREEVVHKREARFRVTVEGGRVSCMCIVKSIKNIPQMQIIDFALGEFLTVTLELEKVTFRLQRRVPI